MFSKIAAFSLLLISAAAFAVVGKPIYSPKHQEFVNSLRKVRTAATIPIPVVVVPPPNTNRYYLHLQWDTNCSNAAEFSWGTNNGFQNTNIFSGGDCRVSNLVYGPIYQFRMLTNCSPDSVTTISFPPPKPPLTNYVWVGATNWTGRIFTNPSAQQQFYRMLKTTNGADLQALNALSGQWLKIGTGTFSSWLLIDHSNNQPNLGQYMHKQ